MWKTYNKHETCRSVIHVISAKYIFNIYVSGILHYPWFMQGLHNLHKGPNNNGI